jgi:hypothetical protein
LCFASSSQTDRGCRRRAPAEPGRDRSQAARLAPWPPKRSAPDRLDLLPHASKCRRRPPQEVAGILTSSTGLEIEPVLLAIRVGLLEDHLEAIVANAQARLDALEMAAKIIASATLKVGDRVELGHNLRPQYLHGKTARVIAQDGEKWIVRLEHPVGRFKNADLRVSATQLATVTSR